MKLSVPPLASENKPIAEEPMFYAPKSGVISSPGVIQSAPPEPAKPAPTIMYSTKSAAPAIYIKVDEQSPLDPLIQYGTKPAPVDGSVLNIPPAKRPVSPQPSPVPATKQTPVMMGGIKYAP